MFQKLGAVLVVIGFVGLCLLSIYFMLTMWRAFNGGSVC